MIKYHGTPVSPRAILHNVVGGNHFCVSFNDKRDAEFCVQHGQSVMFDSGAFTFFRKGLSYDPTPYVAWVGRFLHHPHWAIVPDLAFDGDLNKQREYEKTWTHPPEFSAGVYHQGEPIERFVELCDKYGRTAIGGDPHQKPGSEEWVKWIDEVFDAAAKMKSMPRIHMLRAVNEASIGRWPFDSADSATWARNHHMHGDAWKYLLLQAMNCRNPKIEFDEDAIQPMLWGSALALRVDAGEMK